jgi:integrase/recombinase XerD
MHGVKLREPPRKPAVALSDDELRQLLINAAWRDIRRGLHPRRAWTMMLCYALGTRREELCSITPDDVDRSAGQVLIHGKYGKTRYVPLGPTALAALDELAPYANGNVIGIRPQTFGHWVKEAARLSGFPRPKHRPHTLRKTFATHLKRRGVPIDVISELLGHSSLAITQVYLATEENERRDAVLRLED